MITKQDEQKGYFELFLFVGKWFRLGVILFLLLSVLLGTSGCSTSAATIPWSVATRVVPAEKVRAVITENTRLNPDDSVITSTSDNLAVWAECDRSDLSSTII